ncbi:DUF6519 domain-containing protein [Streptomyces sp. NPDC089799]|uniref:DUF6519 domain-containing protein n=1 Tax=Streptomyces sp. NPDC089799 TaxID=3155066 RepID=UPI003433B89D
MSADISRVSFDPAKHYSRIVHQQGRVTLDSDANEQTAVLLHHLRTVVADLLGPTAAPLAAPGFGVARTDPPGDLAIGAGRLYIDGLLVENDTATTYLTQPEGYVDPETAPVPDGPFAVYLRAWEREITAVQDPSIREIALGIHGPDTAARAKVVWQVALHAFDGEDPGPGGAAEALRLWLDGLHRPAGLMAARARHAPEPPGGPAESCVTVPGAEFRGPENQLYRVQIHTSGGGAPPGEVPELPVVRPRRRTPREAADRPPVATFVWSRENASVALPVARVAGPVVTLEEWGRDGHLSLDVGDMVELVDDATAVHSADDVQAGPPQRVHRVLAVDLPARTVTLDADPNAPARPGGSPPPCVSGDPELHPHLRRWDHRPAGTADALPVVLDTWIPLEDGVAVRFTAPPSTGTDVGDRPGRTYGSDRPDRTGRTARTDRTGRDQPPVRAGFRRGDHWLVPARTVPGDVLWPQREDGPAPVRPHGVDYHYAPLAYVPADQGEPHSLVPTFAPVAGPTPPAP